MWFRIEKRITFISNVFTAVKIQVILLYKQLLWKLPLPCGVADVTETAYMGYSESADFAFILLRGFCGNCLPGHNLMHYVKMY